MATTYQRIGHLSDVSQLAAYAAKLGLDLPLHDRSLTAAEGSPLARPMTIAGRRVGNRFAIHPMEGWDATTTGAPSEHTVRRWRNFGLSGAKLIWGGEAFAVRPDGRANPNQLYFAPDNEKPVRDLLVTLQNAHREAFGPGSTDDLLVGLQLTHSGRFCRPNRKDRLEPRIAYHHPLLDPKFHIRADDDSVLFTDDDLYRLIDCYIAAAKFAHSAGFHFVDIKHCHGYLGHELLSAYDRPGPFGGDLHNRTQFLRLISQGIRAACPGLILGVRLSLFDTPPFKPDPAQTRGGKFGPGIPENYATPYAGFGCDRDNPLQLDLAEPLALLRMMRDELGIAMVNITAGSPYYTPHLQRPAFVPPSDGYLPPEDPLVGCVRQIQAVRQLKSAIPDMPIVGSAFSYLQEFIPQVGQAIVERGWADFIGLGRMVLSYPDMPADILAGRPLTPKKICRTFSDCTTAPRNGIISGCFPLDDYYKKSPEHDQLKEAKAALRKKLTELDAGAPG